MTTGNPFAQLIAQASKPRRRGLPRSLAASFTWPATKTGAMRAYLQEHGKATAHDLAIEADLENTGLVWALLKADIAKGAILREGHFYVWNPDFDESRHEHIQDAIRTLRAAGYTVTRRTR